MAPWPYRTVQPIWSTAWVPPLSGSALGRATEYWRAGVGIVILLIVSVFPYGIGGALAVLLPKLRRT